MNGVTFMRIIEEMRNAQKNYFRTREKRWLEESKRLEKEVDEAIKNYKCHQATLF